MNDVSILQIPHFTDTAFRASVLSYIDTLPSKERTADLFLLVSSNYMWSPIDFGRYIGYTNLYIFVEYQCRAKVYIEGEAVTTYKSKYGYTVASYPLPVADGEADLHTTVFHLTRPQIRIFYLTDEDNPTIRKCKDSISNYCTEYKYGFIHYNVDSNSIYGTETAEHPPRKTLRDVKDRFELIYDLFAQDDYVLVLYNYSVFVNQKTPLHTAVNTIFDKNSELVLKLDTEDNVPVLDNLLIRNMPRTPDILRELMYFSYDLPRMMKYIRNYLFKEVSYTMFYSYFNKRITMQQMPMSYDLIYNFNRLVTTNIREANTLIHYYSCHQTTITPMTSIDGKMYAWGGDNIGCKGTIQFSKYVATTSWGEKGNYYWINGNTYRVEFHNNNLAKQNEKNEKADTNDTSKPSPPTPPTPPTRYIITFVEDGRRFVGYSENGLAFTVNGVNLN